ncbi:ABC transporter substrate-binding protein [Streptomyces sp. YIM 130001]|uniref:ABC transporter substrate-binding protein n=1 Tax=Streptomyces sp. YIM 130001 TaxID=2259644 RepID=UPI001F093B61|nr:ABC transporter substrate-binding protein [Streptomyces sp. YIM 130001]
MTRRTLFTAAGATGASALLAACGTSGDTAPTGGSNSWSFKDDRGKTVRNDGTPKNVVAYIGAAAALHDLGVECKGVFGPTTLKNGKPDIQAGDLDVDKVTVIGNAWGEFNVEKYASLQPDLLVTTMNESPTLWYIPEESAKKVESVAPSIGILTARGSLTRVIDRFAELAESLGADLESKRVQDAEARFRKASASLRRAAREAASRGSGLRVMAVSAQEDLLHVGVPDDFTDLRYYQDLDVRFIKPDNPATIGFFAELSWENADKYQADLILVDRRTGNLQPDELKARKPTWAKLPAVRAGQTVPWQNEARFSHAGYSPLVESLTEALQQAKKVT